MDSLGRLRHGRGSLVGLHDSQVLGRPPLSLSQCNCLLVQLALHTVQLRPLVFYPMDEQLGVRVDILDRNWNRGYHSW